MDLINFFDSAELELPGSWETYPGSFEQYIAEIFANYLANLSAVAGTDYLSNCVRKEAVVATTLCDSLKKCFDEYLLGHPPGSSGFLVAKGWTQMRSEIEFTAEEEDTSAVIGKASEATSGGFQRLDTRVEALGDGVGDGVIEVVEQTA